jgi:hypothetical protein
VARGEVEHRGSQSVDVPLRVALDEAEGASRLIIEGEAREVDRVAAYVHQRAAAPLGPVAYVRRVAVEVAEEAGDGAQISDAPRAQKLHGL